MGPIAETILDGGIVAIITAAAMWLGLAKHMEKKYLTLLESKTLEAAQKTLNELLDKRLDKLRKKAMFNNLVCLRLMKEHPDITLEEIDSLRRSCELNNTSE